MSKAKAKHIKYLRKTTIANFLPPDFYGTNLFNVQLLCSRKLVLIFK